MSDAGRPTTQQQPRPPFLATDHIHGDEEPFLARHGEVFAVFAHHDSGCRGYGLDTGGHRYFVKASVEDRAVPFLPRAMVLHGAVRHGAVIPLLGVATTEEGLLLVYPWVNGEVLYEAPVGGRRSRLGVDPVRRTP